MFDQLFKKEKRDRDAGNERRSPGPASEYYRRGSGNAAGIAVNLTLLSKEDFVGISYIWTKCGRFDLTVLTPKMWRKFVRLCNYVSRVCRGRKASRKNVSVLKVMKYGKLSRSFKTTSDSQWMDGIIIEIQTKIAALPRKWAMQL